MGHCADIRECRAHSGGESVALGRVASSPTSIPLYPFSPSLISLTVSVDVKHQVYLQYLFGDNWALTRIANQIKSIFWKGLRVRTIVNQSNLGNGETRKQAKCVEMC